MQSKILSRRVLLMVVLAGFILFLALLFCFIQQNSGRPLQSRQALSVENAVFPPKPEPKIFGRPVRLNIPKLNVDTTLEYVGLTPDGAVDIPKNKNNAAWFELGPRPGENGNAIITGHYGLWKNGEGSVFDDLDKLGPGDTFYIEDEKGETLAFVVRESRRYDPEETVPEVFVSDDGRSHLNLITCDGVWNETAKSYSKRLVVFADKAAE